MKTFLISSSYTLSSQFSFFLAGMAFMELQHNDRIRIWVALLKLRFGNGVLEGGTILGIFLEGKGLDLIYGVGVGWNWVSPIHKRKMCNSYLFYYFLWSGFEAEKGGS
ncbi:hypothetical protein ACMFMG_001595 [Clarireedia jacksonii]